MTHDHRKRDPDTSIGGPRRNFPKTSQSVIVAVRSPNADLRAQAFDAILESYWKPVYKYIRLKWRVNNEDAKDLTQGFFANAFEKNHLANYDTNKASFQTFLRTCVDGFVANAHKAQQRIKRGGTSDHLSLDFTGAENELKSHPPAADLTPEEYFQREWTRTVFALAVEALKAWCTQSGNLVRFQLFERYDLDDSSTTSYSALAEEFGLTTSAVTNQLSAARRDFRRMVLDKLRQLTASDEEFRMQANQLFGVDVT